MSSDEIRAMQRGAIVEFLWDQNLSGRVLDYGCGIAPYREIIEASGEWHGYNRGIYPGGSKQDIGGDDPLAERWNAVLCTQMLQYVPDVPGLLRDFRRAADRLVLTVATNWPEVEPEDLFRFTRMGMEHELETAGWSITDTRLLGKVPFGDREWCALGYGFGCE